MQKFKAVTYEKHGAPADVLRVDEIEVPEPQPGEALVRMLAAPINPVDLNVIEGKYPVRPPLPAVAGVEGVGEIAAVGAEVRDLKIGTRVLVPHEFGSWRAAGVISAEDLIAMPAEIPVEQAAMLKINPPTAMRMLRDFVDLKGADWIVQNAANSGVGRAVIQIAKACGWRTINVVRRAELIDELRAEGSEVTLLDDDDLPGHIADVTGGAKIQLALNAVGGESAVRLANALAPGGTTVTYGAMGRQPLRIPNGLLIFKDLRWRGFWITEWYHRASREDVRAMFKQLWPLCENRTLHTKIERTYSLNETPAAVEHAQQNRRAGKNLASFERVSRFKKRLYCGAALLLVVTVATLIANLVWKRKLPTQGGIYFFRRVELAVPQFRQGDPQWRDDHLGATPGTLGAEGCAVASAAMVLGSYGFDTDPQRLNNFLLTHDGYEGAGWIRWEKAAEFTPGIVEKAYEDLPSFWLIDSNLLHGTPSIVRIRFQNGITHFVVIVGKAGFQYLIRDPGAGAARGVYPLCELAREIEALRFYRRLAPRST